MTQAPNDKEQLAPMLENGCALPDTLGQPEVLLADNGYFSEANVQACEDAKVDPRGLKKVKGEWNLVTMAWNIKRMFALQPR